MADRVLGIPRPIALICVVIGVAYGLITRLIFGLDLDADYFEIMSVSFIMGVPLVIGFITILAAKIGKERWALWFVLPWAASLLTIAAALLLAWEGLICAFVWVPMFLVLSSVGGVFAGLYLLLTGPSAPTNMVLISVALLPFLASPLEQFIAPPTSLRTVHTQIEIESDAATVWANIREVPAISEAEHSSTFSHRIGFPRPIEARLIGEGIGAVRHATFERDVLFIETITAWEPERYIRFEITADENIPPTTFDQHVRVGGQYFDVLTGSYRIEMLGPERTLLHLSSTQEVSTRFNFYTQLWTDYFMGAMQDYILAIIKRRCEQTAINAARPRTTTR